MKYMKLDQKGAVLAEYIWIDGSNGVRSKTKASDRPFSKPLYFTPDTPALDTSRLI